MAHENFSRSQAQYPASARLLISGIPANVHHWRCGSPQSLGRANSRCGGTRGYEVCERILEEKLPKYPAHFRAMTVRLGQFGDLVSDTTPHPTYNLESLT